MTLVNISYSFIYGWCTVLIIVMFFCMSVLEYVLYFVSFKFRR
jgi:hypothetical protein